MVDVLVVHNVLWAHYKGAVFSHLNRQCEAANISISFIQIAETDLGRTTLGSIDLAIHQYPYKLLFTGTYSAVPFWKRAFALVKAVMEIKPRLVVMPGYYDPAFWILLIACLTRGCRIAIAFDSQKDDKARKVLKEFVKKCFVRFCDIGFTYGTKSKEYLTSLGMARDKIIVRVQAAPNDEIYAIYKSAQSIRFRQIRSLGLKTRNFVFVGRLSPEKNVALLLQAFARAIIGLDQAIAWGLLVVGDGPLKLELQMLARSLGLEGVSFVGGKGWREVPAYLSICDVLVLPSISEPWGLVVNEAMACGLPVIVSDRCGAAHDLVNNRGNGFVFSALSVDDCAKHLRTCMRLSSDEMTRMGEVSLRTISNYSPEKAALHMLGGFQLMLRP
jgi:glycosyltransferase involved in cell wall biosynthesis